MIKVFNKLIRDKIFEKIRNNGANPKIKILENEEYQKELLKKLKEECEEVALSKNKENLTEEIADVLEVLRAIANNNEIKLEEIEKERIQKLEKNGGFEKRYFLIETELIERNF